MIPALVAEVERQRSGAIRVLGGVDQSADVWFSPVMPAWKTRDHMRLRPKLFLDDILARMQELVVEEPTLIHVYEGGFVELLAVLELLRQNDNLAVEFNFNLTDPWHRTFGLTNSRKWRDLSRVILTFAGRLVIFAETRRLSAAISKATKGTLDPEIYPLFSAIRETVVSDQGSRFEREYFAGLVVGSLWEELMALKFIAMRPELRGQSIWISGRWGYQPHRALWRMGFEDTDVKLITQFTALKDYTELHANTSALFLFYFSKYYSWSSSGRALDGLTCGCIVVMHGAGSGHSDGVHFSNLRRRSNFSKLMEKLRLIEESPTADVITAPMAARRLIEAGMSLRAPKNIESVAITVAVPRMSPLTRLACWLRYRGLLKW